MLNNKKRRLVMLSALCCSFSHPSVLLAETSLARYSIDIGYAVIAPNDKSSEISGPGLPPQNSVAIKNSGTIAASVNFYQNEHISYQLYVSPFVGFEAHASGSIAGLGKIATIDILMPTAFANYTFSLHRKFKPYVGIGFNYTLFNNEDSTDALEEALGGPTNVKLDSSTGLAAQAGVRYDINDKWYLNVNYFWADIDSTASVDTEVAGTKRKVDLEIDPSAIYFSAGYKF